MTFFEQGARHVMVGANEGTSDRRYRVDGGRAFLETLLFEEKFYVRTPDTKQMQRVVNLYVAGKIYIADDDNDGYAWHIELAPESAAVIDGSRLEAGRVVYDGRNSVVTDAAHRVLFTRATTKLEPAYGVLLIDRIPVRERYIIVAELLARDR